MTTHTDPDDIVIDSDIPADIEKKKSLAIKYALRHEWQAAVTVNKDILKSSPKDVDTYNRLGFAFLKLGNIQDAKKIFEKAKRLDPYNHITSKNLSTITSGIYNHQQSSLQNSTMPPMQFIEDPGKTKIVSCVNPAQINILSTMHCGDIVFLNPKKHCIEIRDADNRYLGALPDDIAFRLLKLLQAKYEYSTTIKYVDQKTLTVFIREIKRGKKYALQPSFLPTSILTTYTKSHAVHTDKPDISPTGEDGDDSDDS